MEREIRIPEISENVESGQVVSVLVEEGDEIKKDQPILELETEKAAFEIPSPAQGRVKKISTRPGETVKVGQIVMQVEESSAGKPQAQAKAEPKATPSQQAPEIEMENIPASPSVRREARELGVDLRKVHGSGTAGRISSDDVRAAVRQKPHHGEEVPIHHPMTREDQAQHLPLSNVRKVIARRTQDSWRTIPHVTQFEQADITGLELFRKRYAEQVRVAGGKLTFTAILAKVAASALQRFPEFNAKIDMEAGEILYREAINIGIAVETDRGLLVPVVKDAHTKSITQLASDIQNLAIRAREKKLTPDEMANGSFTISNLGGIGGTFFTPIIDPDQAAILGVSRAAWEPMVRDGRVEPRYMLPLSLSFDHRIIDGAHGARFMRWICEALESPMLLELETGVSRNGHE